MATYRPPLRTSSRFSGNLRQITASDLDAIAHRPPLDDQSIASARRIVDEVKNEGEAALRRYALKFGDLPDERAPLIHTEAELEHARKHLPASELRLLESCAERIQAFAEAQRACLVDLDLTICGGQCGHRVQPLGRAGCYAPGGRFPLPSSVLMTVLTAKCAGVPSVWVASPRPGPLTLAAAKLAGADGVLGIGGAQAIAALACGMGDIPACDIIVGPGNRFVTAAKYLVSAEVSIDMLAGPSEVLIIADEHADSALIAADLLAQAEHDPDARPMLIARCASADSAHAMVQRIENEIDDQLTSLEKEAPSSAKNARQALRNGFVYIAHSIDDTLWAADRIAAEHVELQLINADEISAELSHYGTLFIGSTCAEVLGDYGAGPNHVLPTGGTARYRGGLSVFDFLAIRTWMKIDSPHEAAMMTADARDFSRLEGLEAHARAAEHRLPRHRELDG